MAGSDGHRPLQRIRVVWIAALALVVEMANDCFNVNIDDVEVTQRDE